MRFKGIVILLFFSIVLTTSTSIYAKKHTSFSQPHYAWCEANGYQCVRVRSGQSWQSLFPDAKSRSIVMRINHRNGTLYPGLILAVPGDIEYGDLLDYSPFPRNVDSTSEKLIVVDLNKNAWGAYDQSGLLIRWGPATGGKDWCPDVTKGCRTKPGTYRIYSLGSSNCVSSKFPVPKGGAPMPYCMYFNGGQALHGSPGGVVRGNESHGCVRLFVQDAEWLRYDFVESPRATNNYRGTKVVILPY